MKPIVQRWTDEENERLIRAAAEGASAARVAGVLNRKIRSVTLQATRLGVRFPSVREQRRAMIPAPANLGGERPY